MKLKKRTISKTKENIEFGQFMRKHRNNRGMTLEILSSIIDSNKSYLSLMENGNVKPFESKDKLESIAFALKFKEGSRRWEKFFHLAFLCRKNNNSKAKKEEKIEPVEEDIKQGEGMIHPQQRMEDLRLLLNKIHDLNVLNDQLLREKIDSGKVASIVIWEKNSNIGKDDSSILEKSHNAFSITGENSQDIFELIVQAVPILIDKHNLKFEQIIRELK